MKPTITFEESAREEVLSWFGIVPDQEGFVTDKTGERIRMTDVAGIGKMGRIIKTDLPSIIDAMDEGNTA